MLHRMNRLSKRGFTIIEILIAIVILVVGILGILAIFPRAIKSATKTIEDTYSGIISQSVMDSVKMGIRESKIVVQTGGPGSPAKKFFLLQHDGVTTDFTKIDDINNISPAQTDALIYLPGNDDFYIYPKANGLSGTTLSGCSASNDKSRLEQDPMHTEKIYAFGDRTGPGPTQITGASYLADLMKNGTPGEQAMARKDPYLTYGFALVVNRSIVNGQKSDDLFMVMVYVYRNFLNIKGHEANKPVRKLASLIAF